MKKTFLFLLANLSAWGSYAQNDKSTISGTIMESPNTPVAFVTVILLDQDSSIAKLEYTGDDGKFSFTNVTPGEYMLKTNNMTYKPFVSKTFSLASGQALHYPVIQLEEIITELESIEVTATRPLVEVQPDKTVFNVQNSANAAGNDALELMRKAPGIVLDNNDNIILQGKSGVRIYIDGKPSYLSGDDLTSMLRNMSSDQIEKIEIITNPSARYEAEGNAGIINIVLKKNQNLGFNGKLSGLAGYSGYNRLNGSSNFNYRNERSNIYGNYTYHDFEGGGNTNLLKQLNGFELDQNQKYDWNNKGHDVRTGLDYFISDSQTFGAVFQGNFSSNNNSEYSRTPIGTIGSGTIDNILVAENRRNSHTDNMKLNLNYQIKGQNGQSFNLDADYGYYSMVRDGFQPNYYYNPEESDITDTRIFSDDMSTQIDIRTLKGDYETKMLNGKFSGGFKFSNINTTNRYGFFNHEGEQIRLDIDRSSDFDYTETIYAGYSSFAGKIGEKWSYNAGLRVEHTESHGILTSHKQTHDENVKRSYTNAFPSGGMALKLNDINSFSLNYSRRIKRPNYHHLNPFEFKIDELTFRRGNPFLNPQYTHNLQLTHAFMHKLNTTLSYSHTSDYFAQITEIAGEKSGMISQQNIADAATYSMNMSYNADFTKWWSIFTNLSAYHNSYATDYNSIDISLDATSYNIYLQHNFLLPADLKLEVSGWYNSPSIWGGTFETDAMWSMDMGVKHSFFDDKAMLSLSLQDIFKSQGWQGVSDYGGLRVNGNGQWDSRRIQIKLDINIGNQKVKKARNRNTGLEEESERLGN